MMKDKPEVKKLLLIDGDQLVYQITAAAETETPLSDVDVDIKDAWLHQMDTVLYSDFSVCRNQAKYKVDYITEEFDKYIVCFTSTPNFRHDVLPSYKGGRVNKRKPLCYWRVVDYFMHGPETRKIAGLEADDVMSIIATNPKYTQKYDITIWSQDKDMMQVPDTDIWSREDPDLISNLSVGKANHFRYTQALTGDTTDGYKGLKGVGPKAAEKILDSCVGEDEQTYIDTVVSAYMDRGHTVAEAYQQVNCATILRYDEFNFKTMTPILKGDR